MHNAIIDEVLDPERTPSISAILPAYNEDAAIERSVLDVTGILGRLTTDYEIIVVDDGSRDRTTAVLAWMRTRFPGLPLRIVTHQQNRGYGAARRVPLSGATVRVPN